MEKFIDAMVNKITDISSFDTVMDLISVGEIKEKIKGYLEKLKNKYELVVKTEIEKLSGDKVKKAQKIIAKFEKLIFDKKIILSVASLFLVISILFSNAGVVYARSGTRYEFAPATCKKFSKSGKTLTITLDGYDMFKSGEQIKKKKIKFKLSKKCKWTITVISRTDQSSKVKKASYKKIKKVIKADRKYAKKHDDGNILNTYLVVKKKKVVEVLYYYG